MSAIFLYRVSLANLLDPTCAIKSLNFCHLAKHLLNKFSNIYIFKASSQIFVPTKQILEYLYALESRK